MKTSSGAQMLAVDVGAESGRALLGTFDGSRLTLEEVSRFANVPVLVRGTLHWDVLRIFDAILDGLVRAAEVAPGLVSLGIDTWGVDFGLLDAQGQLLGNPVHYRDRRTEGMLDEAFRRVPQEEIYQQTGTQSLSVNTLYQLLAMAVHDDPMLGRAETFLTIPSLFMYWLAGPTVCELTCASTTQCLDVRSGTWATALMNRLGLPVDMFGALVPAGTTLGKLHRNLRDRLRLDGVELVATATHDTASAVAAIPLQSGSRAGFISSGTWSLVGLERAQPLIDACAQASNLTNELGVAGTTRLLRNVSGLWLVQECRRSWAAEGRNYGYEELVVMAERAPSLTAFIDPDDVPLTLVGEMPALVADLCRASGQPTPKDPGHMVRLILESLALKYGWVLDRLEKVSGTKIDQVHVVGGGARNRLLSQLTANACGRPVRVGPPEATVIGNLLVQAIALGHVSSLTEGRELASRSFPVERFDPIDPDRWAEARERFGSLHPSKEKATARLDD